MQCNFGNLGLSLLIIKKIYIYCKICRKLYFLYDELKKRLKNIFWQNLVFMYNIFCNHAFHPWESLLNSSLLLNEMLEFMWQGNACNPFCSKISYSEPIFKFRVPKESLLEGQQDFTTIYLCTSSQSGLKLRKTGCAAR